MGTCFGKNEPTAYIDKKRGKKGHDAPNNKINEIKGRLNEEVKPREQLTITSANYKITQQGRARSMFSRKGMKTNANLGNTLNQRGYSGQLQRAEGKRRKKIPWWQGILR